MSNHVELARSALAGKTIVAAGAAIGKGVAVAADELVTAKAGLFGRWGRQILRYPLSTLSTVNVVANPSVNLLQIEFAGTPPESVVLMFATAANGDCESIANALRARLEGR